MYSISASRRKRKQRDITDAEDDAFLADAAEEGNFSTPVSTRRVRVHLPHTEIRIPNKVLGVLKSVPDSLLREATKLLEVMILSDMRKANEYYSLIKSEFPTKTLTKEMLASWFQEIEAPMKMTAASHKKLREHPCVSTDDWIEQFANISPSSLHHDEWERRVEIWRHYCLDFVFSDCRNTRVFSPEGKKQYYLDYIANIRLRQQPEYFAFGTFEVPSHFLFPTKVCLTANESGECYNAETCWQIIHSMYPDFSLVEYRDLYRRKYQPAVLPEWFHTI